MFTNRRRSKSQLKLANMNSVERKVDSPQHAEAEEGKEGLVPSNAEPEGAELSEEN